MANSKLTICKHCGAEIAKSAKTCPNCGGKNKKPIFLRPWFIILVVVIIISVFGSKGASDKNDSLKIGTVGEKNSTVSSTNDSSNTSTNKSSDKNSDSNKNDGTAAQVVMETPEPTPEPKTIYSVGDILQDGNIQIVYIASGDYHEDSSYLQPKDGNKYIFLEFAFINTGKTDDSVSFYSFEAYADGYNVERYYGADDDLSATLSAGRATSGKLYYEVPIDAQEIEIEYTPNMFLDRKIKFLFEGDLNSGYVLAPNLSRTNGAIGVGETYETSSLRITYLSVEDYVSDNMFIQPKEGYHFVTLTFEFENLGKSDEYVSAFSFDCYANGAACEASFVRDDSLAATISSGRKARGTVTFEVPINAEVIEAEYNNNVWTSNRITFTVK